MSVDYSDFQNMAKQLFNGSDEIDWRVSASKAYYSAYHCALTAADLCPPNGHFKLGSHEGLSDRFKLANTSATKSIAYTLITMKRVRHLADYNLNKDFPKTDAELQLSTLDLFIARIVSFKNSFQG